MHLALQPIFLDKQSTARVDIPSIQRLTVSHGREPVGQGPVTHGGADKEPNSTKCLYSKDAEWLRHVTLKLQRKGVAYIRLMVIIWDSFSKQH